MPIQNKKHTVATLDKKILQELDREAAGRLITAKIPIVGPHDNIDQVRKSLYKNMPGLETINYIYVTDRQQMLIGVFSIKELFQQPGQTKVSAIMQRKLITARPHTDQERVALLAIEHSLKSIPVVTAEGKFLGIITADTIHRILHNESVEDALRSIGVIDPNVQIITAAAPVYFAKRIPWLALGLAGGIFAAFIVSYFEAALKEEILLAAFIPLVLYLGDAVGNQTQTLYIRSLVMAQKIDFKNYLTREIKTSLSIALFLGLTLYLIALFIWRQPLVGMIIGLSIFVTVMVAMGLGILVPFFFVKAKKDPAIASGPFASLTRDIISLLIYFVIAQTLFFIQSII